MFALRITYLMGRVYSAEFEEGDAKVTPEWPPHPSRLFSSLVSAWGEGGAEEDLRAALEWLERQEPPSIHAGDCTVRGVTKAYVPVNDAVTMPEERPRKARTFPSATLSSPDVYFVWNNAPPENLAAAFERLLMRTSSLGHSASLVAAHMADSVPADGLRVWTPDAEHGMRMRVPYQGWLNELIARHGRFERDPNRVNRPPLGKTSLYAQAVKARERAPNCIFDRMIVLKREEGPRVGLSSTLSVMGALRGAMMKFAPQPPPEYLSGHAPGSTPERPVRSKNPHVALVPLAHTGSRHASGDLLGVAALLPRTLSSEELAVCWRVFSGIQELGGMPWGDWKVAVTDVEEPLTNLRPRTWTGPHDVWSTVTPLVFDRFPKDPFGVEAEQAVREAFARVLLPEPAEIALHYNPWHIGVPRASAFPPKPARPGKPQRYHCHVWARFSTAIEGPVAAGAGRFYGYGFFRPLFVKEAR